MPSPRTDDAKPDVELSLESALLRTRDHVGVFYRGDEERDAFVVPLVTTALRAGCAVIYVFDRGEPEETVRQLFIASAGIEPALQCGQIQVVASAEAYLRGGCFQPGRTVKFYQQAARVSRRRGYPVLCVIGEMSWSLRGCPGTDRLLEYEALYAQEFSTAPAITLCLYDLEQTRGEQIFDLLRLHGRIVLNGIEIKNPHVQPEFLGNGSFDWG